MKVIVVVLALTLAACSGGKADTDTASVQTGTGTLSLDHGMPKLPAYAPVYPGAAVADSVVATPNGSGPAGGVLTLTTADTSDRIFAFYDHAANAAGLRKATDLPADESGLRMAVFNRPNTTQSYNLATEPADGGHGTKITLMYQ